METSPFACKELILRWCSFTFMHMSCIHPWKLSCWWFVISCRCFSLEASAWSFSRSSAVRFRADTALKMDHEWRCSCCVVVNIGTSTDMSSLGQEVMPASLSERIYIYIHDYIYESRAKTHERFYIIEVHRHRFEMSARKVPFEKCTRWRKVCGRSAKDQIGDSIYSFFFTISSERFAKGARKMRERRIHSSHVLPKMGCI